MMAAFPDDLDIHVLLEGYGESFEPSVERSAMERGVPKQRVINARVLCELKTTVLFESAAAIELFDRWYFDTIGRVGWFDMEHPRTGTTISARFKGGDIGTLVPLTSGFGLARRDLTLEYLR